MRLMNLDKLPTQQPSYDAKWGQKGKMEPHLNASAKKYYSTFLCDLVRECVFFRTYNRIELPELWARIQRFTGEEDAEFDPDVDRGDGGKFEELRDEVYEQKSGDGDVDFRLEYPGEKYKIGMAKPSDKGQGDEDLDDDNQLDGESGGGDPNLGRDFGQEDINNMFDDSEDLFGGAGDKHSYPSDPVVRHIDEDYDD